jgi:triacylglycerol lipase
MRALLAFLVLALTAASVSVQAQNSYPIILVHGFSGWGRDELLGIKYWGGIQGDIQEQLKAQGYTVYTATVGPFSSNWDRACELYAQIKGGQVDYGVAHSKAHGHSRFGRTFPGLYPQWGQVGANGKVNKVHLFGHSMGGQTIRMLTQLLNKGAKGAPVVEPATTHPLFAGGKDWVHSITTLSTPNQGTLLANGFSEVGDAVKTLIGGVFAVLGVSGDVTASVYDAKLDQWGIGPKQSSETIGQYINRVFASRLFQPGFKDISLWSLSTNGAKEESTWIETLPNVYYYSYSNEDTFAARDVLLRNIQLPNLLTMLLPLQPLAVFMGGRYGPNNGLSEDWQENDGVVNTVSMAKDSVGKSRTFDGTTVIGQWNRMPLLNSMDHLAVIGVTLHTQIKDFYAAHAKLLAGLPAGTSRSSSSSSLVTEAVSAVTATADAVTALMNAVAALNQAASSTKTKADLQALCNAKASDKNAQRYCQTMLNQPNASRSLRG